uniref:CD1e molecule n=1 Tax=Ailuropoda melanoleuca TaxID=9646 RepID=A0A7N5K6F0_AILME
MLLLLLLFEGLVQCGASLEASQVPGPPHPATEEPLSFRVLQTSSFANRSWASSQASGWLGELQTHGWDNALGTISFLRPWSRGNFSAKELRNLQNLFQLYFHGFIIEVQAFEHQFQFELKPEAWLSRGPSPGPGRLLLVCHVSGFHPKPVWVMWMRGEQKQRGTQRGDVLPHADGTWYLRVTLDVAAREAAGLSCRVKHSSLGGQDIVIHWGRNSALLTLLCLVVIVTLLVLLVGHSCFKKHSSNQKALAAAVHGPDSPTGADTQGPRTPGHQLYLPQESWIKNRFLKKWKTSLHQLWGR